MNLGKVGILSSEYPKMMKFYAPSCFTIKCHPLCTDGPQNLPLMITLTNSTATEKHIAKAAIHLNAFHAHPDNVLAMFAYENPDIRQYAVTHLLKARQTVTSGQSRSSMEQS